MFCGKDLALFNVYDKSTLKKIYNNRYYFEYGAPLGQHCKLWAFKCTKKQWLATLGTKLWLKSVKQLTLDSIWKKFDDSCPLFTNPAQPQPLKKCLSLVYQNAYCDLIFLLAHILRLSPQKAFMNNILGIGEKVK